MKLSKLEVNISILLIWLGRVRWLVWACSSTNAETRNVMLVVQGVRRRPIRCRASGTGASMKLDRGGVVIDRVLGHLATHLNGYYRRNFQVAEDVVVVSNLQEVGGAPVVLSTNKVVLFLSSIERDTLAHRSATSSPATMHGIAQNVSPVYLNLLVMCAANFSGNHYPEALKFLSSAIIFFQGNAVFDHQNTPDMDARLDRLALNMENLSSQEMHSLWSIHGGRYVPSVLFRVRMITLDAGMIRGRDPAIAQTKTGAQA